MRSEKLLVELEVPKMSFRENQRFDTRKAVKNSLKIPRTEVNASNNIWFLDSGSILQAESNMGEGNLATHIPSMQ